MLKDAEYAVEMKENIICNDPRAGASNRDVERNTVAKMNLEGSLLAY